MITGKTKSGFKYAIPEENLENYELVEALAETEKNPLVFPRTVELLLGGEQAKKLKEHIRTENGTVPISKIEAEITEIFDSQQEVKNS